MRKSLDLRRVVIDLICTIESEIDAALFDAYAGRIREASYDLSRAGVLIEQALKRINDTARAGDAQQASEPVSDALADIDAGVDDVFDIKTPKNGKKRQKTAE